MDLQAAGMQLPTAAQVVAARPPAAKRSERALAAFEEQQGQQRQRIELTRPPPTSISEPRQQQMLLAPPPQSTRQAAPLPNQQPAVTGRQIRLDEAAPPPGLPPIPQGRQARPAEELQLLDEPEEAPPLRRNMQEEARDAASALHRALSDRSTTVGVSSRASKGIQPWSRGGNRPDVKVQFVQLDEPRVRKLDGSTTVVTKAGETIPYKPLKHGTTVTEYGKGAGKTWRVVEFVKDEDVKITVAVTGRRNLAMKMSTDFKAAGLLCMNYLEAPKPTAEEVAIAEAEEGTDEADERAQRQAAEDEFGPEPAETMSGGVSVINWLQIPEGQKGVMIISVEQVHKLKDYSGGLGAFTGCTLLIDEPVTVASSFGGATVWWPEHTMNVLKQLAGCSRYTILMDADVSIDGKLEAFTRGIAPMRDVLHLQSTKPAMQRTNFIAFSGIDQQKQWYDDWFELSLERSRRARLDGNPNRTFFGGATPRQVIDEADKAQELGVSNLPYHGNMSESTRKEHFADPDKHMERLDLMAANTVMSIGTDLGLKCSWAFFKTAKGSATIGVASLRMLNQLMGRPGRHEQRPLDGITINGVHYPGAMFTLIPGLPPSLDAPAGGGGADRVDRKFREAEGDKQKVLDMCAETDAAIEKEYDERNGISFQGEGGVQRLPMQSSRQSISGALKDILAWNEVERRDNYENHVQKLIELWKLPTSAYNIQPIPSLPPAERAALDAYRQERAVQPPMQGDKDNDRMVSEMSVEDLYEHVRGSVTNEEQFWENCNGLKPKPQKKADGTVFQLPQPEANADGIGRKRVHTSLQHLQFFPDDVKDYCDLDGDREHKNIFSRALMRFIPADDIKEQQYQAQQTGHMGATEIQASLPAATKLSALQEFAGSMGMHMADLLEPREFREGSHRWVAVHNRIQRGNATQEDVAFANRARQAAKRIGLKTKIIVSGQKPTGLPKVLDAVLREQCAMKPGKPDESKLGAPGERHKMTLNSLKVEELAPGCAEKMLVWNPRLSRKVRAGEYMATEKQHIDEQAEREMQRRLDQAQAEGDAEMGDADELVLGGGSPAPVAAPYDKNVMFEPFDGTKIHECLADWGVDQPQREAAQKELLRLSAVEHAGERQDEMRDIQSALRKWEVRHALVAELDASLPPPDEDGRRSLKAEYEYKAGGEQAGRRYARGDWKDFGDGELRSLSLQGLPADLRPKLTGKYLFDFDGVNSDPTIIVNECRRAQLPEGDYKRIHQYAEHRREWIKHVAEFHCFSAGWDQTEEVMSGLRDSIKRWPNMLANGAGFSRLMEGAALPVDSPLEKKLVVPLKTELRQIKIKLLAARCNAAFVARHKGRLERENPTISEHDLENKLFSLLLSTREDEILQISVETVRRLNREAHGAAAFDMLPPERRDAGSLVFDGHMADLHPAVAQCVDEQGRLKLLDAIESALSSRGWSYKIAAKPNHGLQDQPVASAVKGRAALRKAIDKYPTVRAAVGAVAGRTA